MRPTLARMKTSASLDLLLALAGDRTEAAARRLAQAGSAQHVAQDRLDMLAQLREGYEQRMSSSLARGTGMADWQNFGMFMRKVARAVNGQRQILTDAEAQNQQATLAWQQARQREMCFALLAKRAQLRQQSIAAKQEQKAMDEFAANAARAQVALT